MTLEQLARERGVLYSDNSTPCVTKVAAGNNTAASSSLHIRNLVRRANEQCVVKILGAEVTTASFAMYTFSIAVLVQALVLVSFSSVADHGSNRKRLLLGFAGVGGCASMLFLVSREATIILSARAYIIQVVVPNVFALGSLLVIIGVTCLGSSFVLLNSFLPLLSTNDPSVQASNDYAKGSADGIALHDLSEANNLNHENDNDFSASRPITRSSTRSSTKVSSPELELSTKISSKGVGLGYVAAVVMQLVSIALLFAMKKISTNPSSQTLPLRLVLFVVGVWWLAFSVPTYLYLKDRPGPPLAAAVPGGRPRLQIYWQHVIYAWSGLWKTIKTASKLREAVIFLIAWFLLSDAIATVSGTAVLFARTELHMDTIPIALLSITVMVSGEYSSSRFHLANSVLLANGGVH